MSDGIRHPRIRPKRGVGLALYQMSHHIIRALEAGKDPDTLLIWLSRSVNHVLTTRSKHP